MTLWIIPMENAAKLGKFHFTVDLDGVNYQFFFKCNAREDFWYLDILDTEDNPIQSGKKVVSNLPLLRLLKSTLRPAGEPIPLDTRDRPFDPNLENLGTDVIFGYIDQEGP